MGWIVTAMALLLGYLMSGAVFIGVMDMIMMFHPEPNSLYQVFRTQSIKSKALIYTYAVVLWPMVLKQAFFVDRSMFR